MQTPEKVERTLLMNNFFEKTYNFIMHLQYCQNEEDNCDADMNVKFGFVREMSKIFKYKRGKG